MKQVIIFPRGQLKTKDKAKLQEAGMLAIEADDPTKVVMLLPSAANIKADDLLMSALYALYSASNVDKANFFNALYETISEKNKKPEPNF
jgi:hypothetical protein